MKKAITNLITASVICIFLLAVIFQFEWLWGIALVLISLEILIEYFSSEIMYADYSTPIRSRWAKNTSALFAILIMIGGISWTTSLIFNV